MDSVVRLLKNWNQCVIGMGRRTDSWFATTWQGGQFGGQYNRIFSLRIYMKEEFSSQRREMLLFLTINMAAVTSRANQQQSSFELKITAEYKH